MTVRREMTLVVEIEREIGDADTPRGLLELRFTRLDRHLKMECDGRRFLIDREVIEGIYSFVQGED